MNSGGPTVFIVEDDEAMLGALAEMAKTIGLQVEAYRSAQEFLERYDPEHPGCLVLDVRMPGMSGLQLLDELNARDIRIPVIFITGHGDVTLAVRAMKSGAIDFLEKPFKEQDLLDRIHHGFELDARWRRARSHRQRCEERYARLTPRERQLMELLVRGKSGKQMAAEMGITYKSMEKVRAAVMRKMEANSVAQLVVMAVYLEIIRLNCNGIAS